MSKEASPQAPQSASTTSTQPGFVGFVVEAESYTEARAVVYTAESTLLRYGALALIEEPSGRRYLALVRDVSERSMMPSIDQERLKEVTRIVTSSTFQDARKVLELLFSPSQSLIRWHGVRELELRILGEIDAGKLVLPARPPRPSALVVEPDPSLLQDIVSRGLGARGLYLGQLAYNPGVSVLLDPDKLTMHLAVVGQTGSGKTETVKRLVAEYVWRKPFFSTSGGVIVFDIAGEYTGYPYAAPTTVPLLDAVMKPGSFGAPKEGLKWIKGARKTILVPYDLASIGFRAVAEINYFTGLAPLLRELAKRYNLVEAKALAYGRHSIYLVDAGGSISRITRSQAANMIANEDFLVVAAPLPSSLGVDEVEELSRSASAAFKDLAESIADSLGVLEVATINEVKGLAEAVSALKKMLTGNQQPYPVAKTIASAILGAARVYESLVERGEDPDTAEGRACSALRSSLSKYTRFVDCWAWASLAAYMVAEEADELLSSLGGLDDDTKRKLARIASYHPSPSNTENEPGVSPWEVLGLATSVDPVIEQLANRQLTRVVEEGLGRAASIIKEQSWQTRSSIARGLSRIARRVSPFLDASHYRLLVKRLVNGFSIVHLAPPSRGDTDHAVARLVAEAFAVSLAEYSPGRRTLIVVEEAHNLAPASTEKASKHMLLRVAREGRKWGLSLVLVTQRPGFIDPGVLSQASTLIALRITNPDDIAGLRKGSESTSQELVEKLPDLEQGQAIVAGMAVPERRVPLLVRVEKLWPRQAPSQAPGEERTPREGSEELGAGEQRG